MIIEEIRIHTEEKINQLIKEFKNNPEKFLTEEDVRSYLYHLLLEKFNVLESSEDQTESISLHTEVRWYGTSGLKFRSDIVIVNVSTLRTMNSVIFKLPSKGYAVEPQIVIEIKLRRKVKQSDNEFKKKIKKDQDKLLQIRHDVTPQLNNTLYSYLIIFDKKNDICFETHDTQNHKEYYVYPYDNNRILTKRPDLKGR